MAEGVFQHMVDKAGLADKIVVDSAGTGSWHVGEKAHVGTRRELARHGISYEGRARQVTVADMADPQTYIVAMDDANVADLQRQFGPHPRLARLLDFAGNTPLREVPDPYYTGSFETVYQLVVAGCHGLLAKIRAETGV